MAAKYTDTITAPNGNVIEGAGVQLFTEAGAAVQLYADASLATLIGFQALANEMGLVEFYVADGTYTVRQSYLGVSVDLPNTELYDLSDIAAGGGGGGGGSGTVTSVNVSGGATGLSATGGPVTTTGTITLGGALFPSSGGVPGGGTAGQILSKIDAANYNTQWIPAPTGGGGGSGTVTSVAMSVPTGLSVAGSPITTSGTFALTYTAGYQGYTTTEASKLSGIATGATANAGTVTSAAMTVPTGLSITGTPITTNGTFALTYTAGYQGYTTTEATKLAGIASGATANTGTVTSVAALTLGTTGTDLSSTVANGTTAAVITLNVPTASAANRGALSAADWTTFNDKGYLGIPQNSQSAAYTAVLADAGKHIFHPSTDANARTFTIPANSTVAYPIGTALTFINMANVVTIAITTDTMYLAGPGTTGNRTLAAFGMATAIKTDATTWVISGNGIT